MLCSESYIRCKSSKNDSRSIGSSFSHGALFTTGTVYVTDTDKHRFATNLEFQHIQLYVINGNVYGNERIKLFASREKLIEEQWN